MQRRLDPGKETLEGFFQVGNQKEYQNVVIISFVHLEKVNIFCFMHKSVAQKLSLPCPFESQTLNSHKSANSVFFSVFLNSKTLLHLSTNVHKEATPTQTNASAQC